MPVVESSVDDLGVSRRRLGAWLSVALYEQYWLVWRSNLKSPCDCQTDDACTDNCVRKVCACDWRRAKGPQ